ncbi:hypothetical protein DIPPA_34280 [Diplonema papillatum]|nr:hypothetical protein DIPPA_34280 [Diplonema papillatum]
MVAPEAEPRGGLRFFSSADEMLALGRLHRERERRAGTLAEVAALRKLLLENAELRFSQAASPDSSPAKAPPGTRERSRTPGAYHNPQADRTQSQQPRHDHSWTPAATAASHAYSAETLLPQACFPLGGQNQRGASASHPVLGSLSSAPSELGSDPRGVRTELPQTTPPFACLPLGGQNHCRVPASHPVLGSRGAQTDFAQRRSQSSTPSELGSDPRGVRTVSSQAAARRPPSGQRQRRPSGKGEHKAGLRSSSSSSSSSSGGGGGEASRHDGTGARRVAARPAGGAWLVWEVGNPTDGRGAEGGPGLRGHSGGQQGEADDKGTRGAAGTVGHESPWLLSLRDASGDRLQAGSHEGDLARGQRGPELRGHGGGQQGEADGKGPRSADGTVGHELRWLGDASGDRLQAGSQEGDFTRGQRGHAGGQGGEGEGKRTWTAAGMVAHELLWPRDASGDRLQARSPGGDLAGGQRGPGFRGRAGGQQGEGEGTWNAAGTVAHELLSARDPSGDRLQAGSQEGDPVRGRRRTERENVVGQGEGEGTWTAAGTVGHEQLWLHSPGDASGDRLQAGSPEGALARGLYRATAGDPIPLRPLVARRLREPVRQALATFCAALATIDRPGEHPLGRQASRSKPCFCSLHRPPEKAAGALQPCIGAHPFAGFLRLRETEPAADESSNASSRTVAVEERGDSEVTCHLLMEDLPIGAMDDPSGESVL